MLTKFVFLVLLWLKASSASSKVAYFQNGRYIDIIKSGENIQTQSSDVASLGRSANLGDFYDIRTETFTGLSLFSSNSFNDSIYSIDNPYANVDYVRTESISEKTSKLHIGASLSVSAFWGLITIFHGSGSYLKEDKKTFESAKLSLIYSIRTKTDVLKIFTNSSKLSMDLDILDLTDATHIVVGIDWGADIVMSVEETNTDLSTRTEVEGMMGGMLEGIASGIAGAAGMGFDAGGLEHSSTFSIEFNGDVTPDVLPQTFNDSIKFMRNVPDLIAKVNEGRGKKMNYILIPVDTVRKVMKGESNIKIGHFKEIDESILKEAIDLYQDVKNSELLIGDAYNEIENWQHFAADDFSRISTFRSDFKSAFYDMQRNISNSIVNIRRGNDHPKLLSKTISNYANSNWTSNNVMKILASYNKTMEKIKTMKLLQSGRFITNNFEQILTENYMREMRVISVDLDTLDVSSPIFDRIIGLLQGVDDEGIPYYFKNIQDQELIITSYQYGNAVKKFDFSINKHEYLLVKDDNGFVTIVEASNYDLVNSYELEDVKNSIIAVETNRTFYKIDVLTGKIFSTNIQSILYNTNITWNLVGSFPAEDAIIQNNIAENGSEIFFVTQSGILYKFDSKLKATTVLGETKSTGNYASIVKYKDYLYIQKDTGFYEFNGTNVNEILNHDMGAKQDCGLMVVKDKICRIGGNMTDLYPDPITCYDPATTVWSTYGELNQAKHRPGIAYTNRGTVIIGGQIFTSQLRTGRNWLATLELFNEDDKSFDYLSSDFPNGLTAPQAVTFYF